MIIHSPIISGSLTFADGATVTYPDGGSYSGSFSGSIQVHNVQSDLIPDASGAYDLGSEAFPFQDLWLVGSTLNIGGIGIGAASAGLSFTKKSDGTPADIGAKSISIGGIGVSGNKKFKLNSNNKVTLLDANDDVDTIEVKEIILKDTSGNGKNTKLKNDGGTFTTTQVNDSDTETAANSEGSLSGSFTGSIQDAEFNGDATFNNGMSVTGTTALGVTNVSGLASLDGGIDVDGAFTVADSNGNVSTSGTLGVTGLSTLGAVSASAMDVAGHILPATHNTYDLGSTTRFWRDLYLSSGSLYINGIQVLSTDGTDLTFQTDAGESVKILETGNDTITLETVNGDITLTATGNGNIELDAPVQVAAGKNILSSDGNAISFASDIDLGSNDVFAANLAGIISGSSQVVLQDADKTGFTGASSITTLGTITTGVWNGTAIANANLANDGITIDGADISLGGSVTTLQLGTSSSTALAGDTTVDDVSIANLKTRLAGGFASNAVQIGDSTDTVTIAGNAIVSGNLTVSGTTTSVNSNEVNIGDNVIVLNSDETGTPSQNAGIEIERGTVTNATILWDESNDYWVSGLAGAEERIVVGAGNTSITTLGTISTGVWNGTAIASTYIAADAIDGTKIADDAINSEHIVDGAIDTAHIADLNVTTAKIAADAITGAKIGDDEINSEHYAAGSVDTEHLAADSVTNAKIANDSIDSEHYVNGSIDTAHIGDGQVTNAKLSANAVDGAKIADDSIDSEHYVDGSIDNVHLAADCITSTKIGDDQVNNEHIGSNAVDTAQIAADAVTGAKIADDSIDSEHYVDGSIDAAHLASNSVTTVKIADDAVTSAKLAGSYTGTWAVTGAITATGDITAYASSDERLKDNIQNIENPIEKVQSLKGVTWDWNDNSSDVQKSLPNVGVIAQDVEKVLPQLVRENEGGYKAVDYDKLVGLLIEAVKDQQSQIDELKSKLG